MNERSRWEDQQWARDRAAQFALEAIRAEEALPSEVRDRVWSRLQQDARRKRTRTLVAAGGLVGAAAAALTLWVVEFTPGQSSTSTDPAPQQTPYARGVAPRLQARDKAPRPAGRNAEPPATPPDPQPPSVTPDATSTRAPSEPPAAPRRTDDHGPRPDDAAAPSTREPRAKVRPASTLAAETRALTRAREALAADDSERALALLRAATRQFSDGVLLEERQALKVVALCAAGDIEAGREAARTFLQRHPQSTLRDRVRTACTPR